VYHRSVQHTVPDLIVRGTPAYWRMAVSLLMAGFSTFALMYGVQPLLPLFSAQFGVNAATASLAVSLTTGAMALAFIPAAVLSDRIGRRSVMIFSLLASAVLTLLSALLPGWMELLAMRAAIGVALAGLPSVAMAYVSEEVHPNSIGSAMGLYIAASAIGGMAGRLGVSFVSQYAGWREAIALMGAAGLAAGLAFAVLAPQSRAFGPTHHDLRSLTIAMRGLLADKVLPLLYVEGFLLMGVFVTIYNYVSFRLEAPPYGLSQAAVGFVFLVYLLGSFSSAWIGGLSSRLGPGRVFWMPIAVLAAGIALTAVRPLAAVLCGIAIITGAFFAAHSTASGWVGRRATRDRAQASALYLLFYYLGSSLLGSAGGIAWNHAAWLGVAGFTLMLTLTALVIAVRLAGIEPRAPMQTPGR
jgi:MFS transporter, YNFM family, putative membrane transport protein